MVRNHTYSNWRALRGVHPGGDDDRTEPEAASEPAVEASSTQDIGSIGAGSCSGIGLDKAWRRQRRNCWRGFRVAAALEEVDVVAEGGFACFRAFAGHLLRYFRCFPWFFCRCLE